MSDQGWQGCQAVSKSLGLKGASPLIEEIGRGHFIVGTEFEDGTAPTVAQVWGERKERTVSVTGTGWQGFINVAKSFGGGVTASDLLEKIGYGEVVVGLPLKEPE